MWGGRGMVICAEVGRMMWVGVGSITGLGWVASCGLGRWVMWG